MPTLSFDGFGLYSNFFYSTDGGDSDLGEIAATLTMTLSDDHLAVLNGNDIETLTGTISSVVIGDVELDDLADETNVNGLSRRSLSWSVERLYHADGVTDALVLRDSWQGVLSDEFTTYWFPLAGPGIEMPRYIEVYWAEPPALGRQSVEGGPLTGSDGFSLFTAAADGYPEPAIPGIALTAGPDGAELEGGVGPDTLLGGLGNDVLVGNEQNDWLVAGDGDDTLVGGPGDDKIFGGSGTDTAVVGLALTEFETALFDRYGSTTIVSSQGRDVFNSIEAFEFTDGVFTRQEFLESTLTHLFLLGTEAADTLTGGAGNDSLFGLAGDDLLIESDLHNQIAGADGNDTIWGGRNSDNIGGGSGNDSIRAGAGSDTIGAGPGDDFVQAGQGYDSISGGDGNDTLRGGNGDDTISAGPGDDWVRAGSSSARADSGHDSIFGGDGNDTLLGDEGNDTIGGSFGDDLVRGQDGEDSLGGGPGQDTLSGGPGNDTIGGGEGDDTMRGNGGSDFLAGGGRDDQIDGGAGDDTINGGDGDDTMTGGDGPDVFVFNFFKDGDADVITDFEDGTDSFLIRIVNPETGEANISNGGNGLQGYVAALNITDTAEGALIDYEGHTVLIEGVAAADLTVDDFQFL